MLGSLIRCVEGIHWGSIISVFLSFGRIEDMRQRMFRKLPLCAVIDSVGFRTPALRTEGLKSFR